jgi:mono/diheme cytochrome c family protein
MRYPLFTILLLISAGGWAQDGERLFNRVCAACHQAGARGVTQTYPELREHLACFVGRPGGREYVIGVVSFGLEGDIAVGTEHFSGSMPAATAFSATEKASVLNYVLSLSKECPAPAEPISAAEVTAVMNAKKWTPETLHSMRSGLTSNTSQRAAEHLGDRVARGGSDQAPLDFKLHCRGCHNEQGEGVPGLVPSLRGNVALFLQTAEGREFVSQVPGVAFAPLDDARLADLLNWVMESFSADQWRDSGYRYTAATVAEYRRKALVDVKSRRLRVIADLKAAGFEPPR